MTINELIIAEAKARQAGNIAEANILRDIRWQRAMRLIVNSENTRERPRDA